VYLGKKAELYQENKIKICEGKCSWQVASRRKLCATLLERMWCNLNRIQQGFYTYMYDLHLCLALNLREKTHQGSE
jgi:hypothetical protein